MARAPRLIATALVLMGAAAFSSPTKAASTKSCMMTAKAGFQSCKLGAQSDGARVVGNCDNIPDPSMTKACLKQASTDRKDAVQSCKDQDTLRKMVCARLGPGPYAPSIDPTNFTKSTVIDNDFFPLIPGTTFIYEGQTADGFEHVEFAVTHVTKMIANVNCVEVHDTRKVEGKVVEDTRDWFAQDNERNVWYFGENTTLVSDGLPVDLSGSWTGGVDGAQPGIVMKGQPAIGDFYRQEFSLTRAEDLAEVKSLSASATVPFPPGSFDNCLETEESSSIAPGDVEHKFYAKGIGNLLTIDMAVTPNERSELVQILTGQP
jgi:hypothetical protein